VREEGDFWELKRNDKFVNRLLLKPVTVCGLSAHATLLGPAAKWRPSIVPNNAATAAPLDSPDTARTGVTSGGADAVNSHGSEKPADATERHARNYAWSELMKRVFAADVLACTHCGGRLRILATIRAPEITRRILDHLGIPSRPPPLAAAVFHQLPFAFE